ncbi:DUF2846 domain-containing protein [Herbaspirillum sp.]|uniref:DUF2846 domain-containing protein n=1 Tax=Herbaspirillum sp. TaxID=1890675 RepID=UPI001B259111|nr:DUF2846 domain-containing protein [Herbaspirillum sp.]MBO9536999.1 DUF2846 domain-containing protein [Herbaspirillum sp.]
MPIAIASFRKLLITAIALSLLACTHAPRNKAEISVQDPGMATIYLYRGLATSEQLRTPPFYATLNNKPVTPLPAGNYISLTVPPGRHHLVVSPGPYGYNRGVTVQAEAGATYFYQFEFKLSEDHSFFSETALSARDEAIGRNDVKTLTRALANFNDRRLSYRRTNYAGISDIDAVPAINERGREGYRNWLKQKLPRAFVIASNGAWDSSWGMSVTDIPGISDPTTRAMQRCAARQDVVCQAYAINNSVVWKPLPVVLVQRERERRTGAAAATTDSMANQDKNKP